jgi:elongation factor 1-beta
VVVRPHSCTYSHTLSDCLLSPVDAVDGPAAEEEEDIDLFGDDDEEDAEAEKLKAERLAAYAAKKATKPKTIAKSVVTFEVKPWDDETDMVALENAVRSLEMDGLVWGASKLVAVGYGIKKLQITIVIGASVLLDRGRLYVVDAGSSRF